MDTNQTDGSDHRTGLLLKEEVYAIVGAAMAVFNELGAGFLAPVYQEAMEIEMKSWSIPFESQKVLRIKYRGQYLTKEYCADLLCYGTVLVELKAMRELTGREQAQLLNYLKTTGLRVGVLINFGDPGRLEWIRLVR